MSHSLMLAHRFLSRSEDGLLYFSWGPFLIDGSFLLGPYMAEGGGASHGGKDELRYELSFVVNVRTVLSVSDDRVQSHPSKSLQGPKPLHGIW